MKGIYTTCVNKGTLDESPFAYKPMDEIVANIKPTAQIVSRIKPIYNFKAGDEDYFLYSHVFLIISSPFLSSFGFILIAYQIDSKRLRST